MNEGHFIGQHDKTTCGGTVLDGDTSFMWYGIAHALEGDRVTCGKDGNTYQIVGGISHMISHGKAMAGTLDSHSNCPCRAQLIPSVVTASYRNEDSAPPMGRAFVQPANQSEKVKATESRLAEPTLARKTSTAPGDPGKTPRCNHPDQMEELAVYIAGEMNRNILHPAVLKMKELLNYDSSAAARQFQELPWYARLAGSPNFNAIALTKKVEAMAIWTKQVGQDMEWDHKPKLRERFPGVRHKQGGYLYYYDIWSNIHYGYVGIIGGLSDRLLLDGAGAEQIALNKLHQMPCARRKSYE
ncbi:polymorphic toxin type 44 domain-containing protein [Pseudomonas sp. Sample_24]|uniref:polymorphic toxin type 44 domain-containing protein n=1 Tax=Pseudomonas sp. Sample_24 TaxID=2448268 RepID=UPI001F4FEB35|nr:polymorphic toxin type 44 domain-containing protein [Pseudomonas sp. Sample_24]